MHENLENNFSESQLPTIWDSMAPDETFLEVPLNSTSKEYRDVETLVMSSADSSVRKIISVSDVNELSLGVRVNLA